MFNFGQDRYRRIHTLDAIPQTPKIRGRVLSLSYWLHSYFAMAAHPNHAVSTYCFLVDPLCYIRTLNTIFSDAAAALEAIRNEARAQLLATLAEPGEENVDQEWVERGTESWDDFGAFAFEDKGIELHFAPYHVAAYAAGPQSVLVSYEKIAQFVSPVFKSALDIEYVGSTGPVFATSEEVAGAGV